MADKQKVLVVEADDSRANRYMENVQKQNAGAEFERARSIKEANGVILARGREFSHVCYAGALYTMDKIASVWENMGKLS